MTDTPKKPTAQSPQKPTMPGERIAKVLSRAGIASRRDAEVLIEEGRVMVNGRKVASPALNVLPKDKIFVDGKEVGDPEPPRLWLYHKPLGLVTTAKDEKGRETVFDKLPKDLPRVMSVGRLDLNSEGLLLLTNDGEIKRRLELPGTGWLRKYRVRVKGTATEAMLEPLRHGVEIDGEAFQPMEVVFDRQQGANAWLTVGLREGKNREIRRAMEHIGLTVNRLIRISYGPFRLGTLQPGAVEEVRPRVMRDQLGLDDATGFGAGSPKREVTRGGKGGPRKETTGRDPRANGKPPFKGERDGDFKPRGEGKPGGFKQRGEGKPPYKGARDTDGKPPFKGKRDGDFKPRGEGKPGGFKPRGEGKPPYKGARDTDGKPPFKGKRDGDFKPRGEGKPGGFKKRDGEARGANRSGKPGGFKSQGYKSRGGGAEGKPRSQGFKSHGNKPGGKPSGRPSGKGFGKPGGKPSGKPPKR